MKAAQLAGIRRIDMRELPLPRIVQPNDVLIKMTTVGVCGSDIHYFTDGKIGPQIVSYPALVGHEGAGVVAETGTAVTRVRAGDRIAIDPAVSCGTCDQCLAGRENTCRSLLFLGCPKQIEGCMCEYIVLPENSCFTISKDLTFEQAVLSEPLAIALYAVEQAAVKSYMSVGILGAGPIGMSVLAALHTANCNEAYMTEIVPERIAFANKQGSLWCGHAHNDNVVSAIMQKQPLGLDVVFECSGKESAIFQAVDMLKPGGTLAVIGIPETDTVAFPLHTLRRKEISIRNIRRQNRCTQKAIDLLECGKINLDSLITHRFCIEQSQAAFDLVAGYRDGVMKAMISI